MHSGPMYDLKSVAQKTEVAYVYARIYNRISNGSTLIGITYHVSKSL